MAKQKAVKKQPIKLYLTAIHNGTPLSYTAWREGSGAGRFVGYFTRSWAGKVWHFCPKVGGSIETGDWQSTNRKDLAKAVERAIGKGNKCKHEVTIFRPLTNPWQV